MIDFNEHSHFIKPMHNEFSGRFNNLCSSELGFVKERLKKICLWTEEDAEEARKDFLRFVSLTFVTTETIVPSKQVDEFWHNFILFTRPYVDWSESHWGRGVYLHHNPGHIPGKAWEHTQGMVLDIFGANWPHDAQAASCCSPPPPEPALN
ncbi:hypothetical protein [Janthinobacterium sp.]|uniref:hypothetical protein n=1 Tax=Janthinobacterium sp. TaxID=1871054 RepID=UPI00293DA147|nr:hypothetical protein [Janthinobacterium sp.]